MNRLSAVDSLKFSELARTSPASADLQWMLNDIGWAGESDLQSEDLDRAEVVLSAAYFFDYWVCTDGMLYYLLPENQGRLPFAAEAFGLLGLKRHQEAIEKLLQLKASYIGEISVEGLLHQPRATSLETLVKDVEQLEEQYHELRDESMTARFVDWVLKHRSIFFQLDSSGN